MVRMTAREVAGEFTVGDGPTVAVSAAGTADAIAVAPTPAGASVRVGAGWVDCSGAALPHAHSAKAAAQAKTARVTEDMQASLPYRPLENETGAPSRTRLNIVAGARPGSDTKNFRRDHNPALRAGL